MEKQNNKGILKELLPLATGELIVSLLTVGVYLLLDVIFKDRQEPFFDYTVAIGAVLGSIVVLVNFFILTLSVNRAVERFIEERGEREMTEEEAADFANEHQSRIQLAVARSYIVRTLVMIGALVLAFVSGWFDPISTLVPLVMYKPIIYVTQMIDKKKGA